MKVAIGFVWFCFLGCLVGASLMYHDRPTVADIAVALSGVDVIILLVLRSMQRRNGNQIG